MRQVGQVGLGVLVVQSYYQAFGGEGQKLFVSSTGGDLVEVLNRPRVGLVEQAQHAGHCLDIGDPLGCRLEAAAADSHLHIGVLGQVAIPV